MRVEQRTAELQRRQPRARSLQLFGVARLARAAARHRRLRADSRGGSLRRARRGGTPASRAGQGQRAAHGPADRRSAGVLADRPRDDACGRRSNLMAMATAVAAGRDRRFGPRHRAVDCAAAALPRRAGAAQPGVRQPDLERREVHREGGEPDDLDRIDDRRRDACTTFATTASVSTSATRRNSSACSSDCIASMSSKAPASAWRSCIASSTVTAGASGPKAR